LRFKIIYADPPWDYRNKFEAKKFWGVAEAHYHTMNPKKLRELDVASIAEDNSLLCLWATWPNLKTAIEVGEAWGFKYVTGLFNWIKTYKSGVRYFGLGFHTRSGSECVLLFKRGKGVRKISSSVLQVVAEPATEQITSPVTKHSCKPPEVRDRIVELYGDVPRVELFARKPVPDAWVALGEEIDGKDIVDALDELSKRPGLRAASA